MVYWTLPSVGKRVFPASKPASVGPVERESPAHHQLIGESVFIGIEGEVVGRIAIEGEVLPDGQGGIAGGIPRPGHAWLDHGTERAPERSRPSHCR